LTAKLTAKGKKSGLSASEGAAMKILVYGAGVHGSLYSARLHDVGH